MVGLSDAATRQRIRRLKSMGVIDIVAVTDPRKLGFGYQAMVGVKVVGDTLKVAGELGRFDEAHYVVVAAGRYDIVVEVVCTDAENLMELGNRMRAIDGVTSIEVTPYLVITKETYNWGAGQESP